MPPEKINSPTYEREKSLLSAQSTQHSTRYRSPSAPSIDLIKKLTKDFEDYKDEIQQRFHLQNNQISALEQQNNHVLTNNQTIIEENNHLWEEMHQLLVENEAIKKELDAACVLISKLQQAPTSTDHQ